MDDRGHKVMVGISASAHMVHMKFCSRLTHGKSLDLNIYLVGEWKLMKKLFSVNN